MWAKSISENMRADPGQAASAANARRAAASVASITASSCVLDTKPASYADGAKYTPSSSIRWKKRLKRSVSLFVTSAKLVGTRSAK